MSNEFVQETALAWHIHPKKVAELADWVERKVNPDYQAIVFTKMLRKYMETYDANKGGTNATIQSKSPRPPTKDHSPKHDARQNPTIR